MKLNYIKGHEKLISVTLSGVSILFAGLICMKIISYYQLSTRADNIKDMAQIIVTNDCNKPEELEKYLDNTKEMADNLKKSNLFAPPQTKSNPVTQVTCILGDEAWINNKWYKEGDMVQDAKVVSIEPTQVTIEWEGQTKVFNPLGAQTDSNGSNRNAPPMPNNIPPEISRIAARSTPSQPEQPPVEIPSPDVVIMAEPPSGFQIPDEAREAMKQMGIPEINPEMIQNMSIEDRERFMQMQMKMQRN